MQNPPTDTLEYVENVSGINVLSSFIFSIASYFQVSLQRRRGTSLVFQTKGKR
jgi:hypothetical protein